MIPLPIIVVSVVFTALLQSGLPQFLLDGSKLSKEVMPSK